MVFTSDKRQNEETNTIYKANAVLHELYRSVLVTKWDLSNLVSF